MRKWQPVLSYELQESLNRPVDKGGRLTIDCRIAMGRAISLHDSDGQEITILLRPDMSVCRLVEVEDMPQAVMTPERVAALKHVVVAASYGYLEGWDGPGVRDAIEQWSRLQSELEGNNATL